MALPSYAEVASRIGVTICRGVLPRGGYCPLPKSDHQRGVASLDASGVLVHWADRRPTYGGVRDFVMVVAGARFRLEGPAVGAHWRLLFYQLRLAKSLLITARLRPRSDVWAEDMARLHAMAIAAPRSPERDRAVRWSQGH